MFAHIVNCSSSLEKKEEFPSYRNRVSAVLELLIALSIAFLGGYAVYCFMTKFGQ